ncbi:hypothetical protein B0A55_02804 [Friedmanniomyces simplex]|uniref:HORMA domain-containing protein n=1 Tax=Friedmanniomyces simplex TaxID=329884 RepID=A0A4U0XML4_9PEZI|nr:hypothetical protein B0A55_02804 [Friedmanniomyces simplex]
MQLQKTRNTKTVTKIDQKQSLEVIQTMLHGSLSTLSFLRAFFAEKFFDKQVYRMADHIQPYEDYAAGNIAHDGGNGSEPVTPMQVMRRGRGKRADTFLDWLEKGAFTALQAGHLRALQVYVHTDPLDRSKVIEMYTFTIKYDKDAENRRTPSGLEFDAPGDQLVSVEATNLAFQTLLNQLYAVCDRLPALPAHRFVSMELFYVPGCEEQHKPAEFVQGTGTTLCFPEAEGWEKKSKTLPELGALFHESALKVTSLVPTGNPDIAQPLLHAFHENLRYTLTAPKLGFIDSMDGTPLAVQSSERSPTATSGTANAATPSTVVEEVYAQMSSGGLIAQNARNDGKFTAPMVDSTATSPRESFASAIATAQQDYVIADSINTQSAPTLAMTNAVRDMMQPETITQGDTQTQRSLHRAPAALSLSTESPGRTTASPEKSPTTAIFSPAKPALLSTKAQKLEKERLRFQKQALALVKQASRKTRRGHTVLCQCGHEKDEGPMVQCAYCQMWQHLPCYGYTAGDDPRLPETHVCYQCLLGDEEKLTLKKLKDLAMNRRGMDFALQQGLWTQGELARDLELEPAEAQQLYGYLKSSGFVVPSSGSHIAGHKATGRPLFVAVRKGRKHELMLQSLFDPLSYISHHYTLPVKPIVHLASLTQRLLASQSSDMPPPATPVSQLRLRSAATPASGLDLRAATPLKTPSRTHGLRSMTRKRSSDGALQGGSPAKRAATPSSTFARMRSMQSRVVINANGLSSSPGGSTYGQ